MRSVAYGNWRDGRTPGSPLGTPSWSSPRAVPAESDRGGRIVAAAGRPHGFRVTPQQRGYRDASIKRLEAGTFQLPRSEGADGVELQPAQLALLLSGIDLHSARQRKRFDRAG